MIYQTHRVKQACTVGFAKLDQLTSELNLFSPELDTEIQRMQTSMALDISCDAMGGNTVTMGNKMSEALRMIGDLQNRWTLIETTISNLSQQNARMSDDLTKVSRAPREGGGSGGNRPILEFKSIQNLGQIGNDRTGFLSWSSKAKNVLRGIFGKEAAWKFWIDVAESNYKDVEEVRTKGYEKDQGMDEHYDSVADCLMSILKDKVVEGSDPGITVNRYADTNEDGIKAWHLFSDTTRRYREKNYNTG